MHLVAPQDFQAEYGRGDELVALFEEMNETILSGFEASKRFTILTDVTRPSFTVVTDIEVENLAAWEGPFRTMMAHRAMGQMFGQMLLLVESGHREFSTVVE